MMEHAANRRPAGINAGDLFYRPAWRSSDGSLLGTRLDGIKYIKMLSILQRALGLWNYLEIGTNNGSSVSAMSGQAICVDPSFKIEQNVWANKSEVHLYQLTSDNYFINHKPISIFNGPVQLAFIDGMHHYEFVLRDFMNVEASCTKDSLVVIHDCLPWKFAMTSRLQQYGDGSYADVTSAWTGDVWRALPILASLRPDLQITFLDCPPTGLVAITKLDPSSTVLRDGVESAIARASQESITEADFWNWLENQTLLNTRDMAKDEASLRQLLGL